MTRSENTRFLKGLFGPVRQMDFQLSALKVLPLMDPKNIFNLCTEKPKVLFFYGECISFACRDTVLRDIKQCFCLIGIGTNGLVLFLSSFSSLSSRSRVKL